MKYNSIYNSKSSIFTAVELVETKYKLTKSFINSLEMKYLMLLFLLVNIMYSNAQTGFKVYNAEQARFIQFKLNQNIKFNFHNNPVYKKDKIISVSDSGFLTPNNGFIHFDSLQSIGRNYKNLNLVAYTLLGLTELNLMGAILSGFSGFGFDAPQVAATTIFIIGNAVGIPYFIYYQKPNLKPLNKVGSQTHFLLTY